MADATQLDIPPECVSSQTAKCQEESTSGQTHEVGFQSGYGEPTKQNIGYDVLQNELQGLCNTSNDADDQLQFGSSAGKSQPEQLGLPHEDVSNSSQGGSVNLEQTQNGPLQTRAAFSCCSDHSQSLCGNVTKTSLAEQLELPCEEPHEDMSLNCQAGKPSFSEQISLGQRNDFDVTVNMTYPNEQAGMPPEDLSKTMELTDFGFGTSSSELVEDKQHLVSDILQDGRLPTIIPVGSCGGNELLQVGNENVTVTYLNEQARLPPEAVSKTCQTKTISCSLHIASDQINESDSGSVHCETEEHRDQLGSFPSQNDQLKNLSAVSDSIVIEQSGPSVEEIKGSVIGHLEPPHEDASKDHTDELIEPHMGNATQNSSLEPAETASEDASKYSSQLGCKDKKTSSSRKRSRSLVSSDRVLRSRTGEKPGAPESSNNVVALESSNNVANVSNEKERKRKKRKKQHRGRVPADEFSRIRSHLRYFLNRINYEKSLIDAYSGEGWKGNSLEKLRPEKELQRATSEILRRKLKIRDLFQRLDSLCAEGMFPESLFDSEGQIDSEDIFCAKCGSKDLTADNDIILCDGACDRGFHQHCLEPPLLTEEIPPDDEGWLCPGCDCKVDCFDLLNESQGTDLSVADSWEKVFPEAAVAASAGQHQENSRGLLSDDSDDNDYDPDGPDTDQEVEAESSSDEAESSTDESEYALASDGLETPKTNDEQYLGLPSDDSEDDDFNPDAPDPTEDVNQDSSSSDFSSDSEDLAAVLEDAKSTENGEGPYPPLIEESMDLRGSCEKSSKCGQKRYSLKNELSSFLESNPGQDGLSPVSGKRHVERLDYKKLHDEEYGNIPTSDDEDYSETAAPTKRNKGTAQVSPGSRKGRPSTIKNGVTKKDDPDRNEHTPRRTARRKSSAKDNTPDEPLKSSPNSGSTSGRTGASTYKRLGEAVTQRLSTSFTENQYPDRSMKERLAQELGIMAKQVGKWFANARHCVKAGLPLPQAMRKQPNQAENSIRDTDHNGAEQNDSPASAIDDAKDNKSATPKGRAKTSTPRGRKRKSRSDPEVSVLDANIKTPPETSSKGGRVTRRRKSVA